MGGTAPQRSFDRFIVIVCDSLGCGDAPDAEAFGDSGANTIASIVQQAYPTLPHLARLGLGRIPGVPPLAGGAPEPGEPLASFGRMTERSGAKDTMSGHWELMCVISHEAFPMYPQGFPPEVMTRFEEAIGRRTLGNIAASGTEIIHDLGGEHMRTGAPIVYTSGDSVFQVAAHEDVIPVDELYAMCDVARAQLEGPHRVARVIARPFVGSGPDDFKRTPRRRDYALPPPRPTALDILVAAGLRTHAVGKIHDIFAGRGLSDYTKTVSNADGVDKTIAAMRSNSAELIFTNLVDFDSLYGHRRDVTGYAAALEEFDDAVPRLLDAMGPRDCLVLTADHGNDPAFRGTDHTRERVPLLVSSRFPVRDLGTRGSFADLGQTVLHNFGLQGDSGESFLPAISG